MERESARRSRRSICVGSCWIESFAQGWSLSMWSCSRSDSEPTILWYFMSFHNWNLLGLWSILGSAVASGNSAKVDDKGRGRLILDLSPGIYCLGSGCFCLAVVQMKSSRIMEAKACPLTLGSHWVFCGSSFYMIYITFYHVPPVKSWISYPCSRMVINPLIGIAVNVAIIRNS